MEELVHSLADGDPATRCPASPVSAGAVSMPPRHAARAHQHTSTWIYVVVLRTGRAGVATRYGHHLEHEVIQHAGDLLIMPPGIPHAAINLSRWRSVYALELRVSESVHQDNHVLTHLQHVAAQQRPRATTWPLPAVIRLLRAAATTARRWARRRSPTHRDHAAHAAADTSADSSATPLGADTQETADTPAADDARPEVDGASRNGPQGSQRCCDGSCRPFMDWSDSFPLPAPASPAPAPSESDPPL